jgi:UDP-glucose 4-epimerase
MRILITGSCGFIGRELIRELEGRHELQLLDSVRPEDATMFGGAAGRIKKPLVTDWPFILADITDPEQVQAAVEGVDAVIHLAGEPRGLPEIGVHTFKTNALGTFVALDCAHRAGVGRFLCASSINAYGTIYWRLSGRPVDYMALPLREDHPTVVEDPYSLAKLTNEETCHAYHRAYGITTAAFRFSGVWSQERFEQFLTDGMPETTEWKEDLWNWVHLRDVVTGLRQAVEAPNLPGFGVYNLNAPDTRAAEPTEWLIRRFKPEYMSRLTEPLPGRTSLVSIKAAKSAFGYEPYFSLEGSQR